MSGPDRGEALSMAAGLLCLQAMGDPTVTGGTLMLPDGSTRYLSLADAKTIVGYGAAGGHA